MDDRTFGIGISLGVHVFVLAALAFSFHNEPARLPVAAPVMEAVETVAVDEAMVERELKKLRTDEQARRAAEAARQQKLAKDAEQMRLAREKEAKRLADLKKKRDQEQRASEAERKRLADLKAEQQRVAAEKAAIEKKREEEAKRLKALQEKREAQQKAEAEAAFKAKLAAEQERLVRETASINSRIKAEYIDLIANKVSRNWLRPAGTAGSVNCQVFVRQLPGGEVEEVRLLQSCGSPALDRSVEAAVRKASPLPAPPTPDVFDREINFRFHTEG
ncbi:MAG: cell envelope integrity protein TolA [Gammaproteobacteria bacterium]|nr:cell envelope integrity protein TolA [Gammaproteobacteria bacterium]